MTAQNKMSQSNQSYNALPIVAVDVGNARIKFGLFGPAAPGEATICGATVHGSGPVCEQSPADLPEPRATLACDGRRPELERIAAWLGRQQAAHVWWFVGTVNRPSTTRLLDFLRARRPADPVTLLAAGDLPLKVKLPRPDMVGIDRLLDAVAADHLREPGRAAAVVDVGTAVTVDLLSPAGEFLGGAILPGIAMSARAMHEQTDLLPLVEVAELGEPPPAVGIDTRQALHAGLFWGTVGAIGRLVEQFARELGHQPQVFLTGGAGPTVAELLGTHAQYLPHLTLSGIALTAERYRR